MKKRTIGILISLVIAAVIVFTMATQKKETSASDTDETAPVEKYEETIFPFEMEIAQIKDDLKEKKEELAKQEKILGRGIELLENNSGPKITVGGETYLRETLVLDVSKRLQVCKTLREEIKGKEQLLSNLQAILNAELRQSGLSRDEEVVLKNLRTYFQENKPAKSQD